MAIRVMGFFVVDERAAFTPNRRSLLLVRVFILASGLVFAASLARCSGDSSTNDAGSDSSVADVAPDYFIKETAPPTAALVDIAAGAQHTCALVDYGGQKVVYCFGDDPSLGGTKTGLLAVASNGLGTSPLFLSLAGTYSAQHTCALDSKNQPWCWGLDTSGQCGQGTMDANIPAPGRVLDFVDNITKAASIALGKSSTCVVRSTGGKVACFGDNTTCTTDFYDDGGCATGISSARDTTDQGVVFKNVTTVGLGVAHGCVGADPVSAGSSALFCFGDNASLESGPSGAITSPASTIATPANVASIAAGDAHTCFITTAHELFCFGKNDVHQASPTSATSPIAPSAIAPIALPSSAQAAAVYARASETCVVDLAGVLYCFGQGHAGNIDVIAGVKDVGKVAMGGAHTCVVGHAPSDAISAPGSLLCWGDNTKGQAGQAPGASITTPTAVVIPAAAPP